MKRAALALLCVLLAAAVGLLPEADPVRLAATDVHTLLDDKVGPAPAEGAADTRITLGEQILSGPAIVERGEGTWTLSIYGCLFAGAIEGEQLTPEQAAERTTTHLIARRSIIRGLREIAADQGISLAVRGENDPVPASEPTSASFFGKFDGQFLVLQYTAPTGEEYGVQSAWQPAKRSSLWPPVIAILLAIAFRKPVIALFAGVWVGVVLLQIRNGETTGEALLMSLPRLAQDSFWPLAIDPDKLMIVGFVVAMLSMVGVMSRSGGIRGIVDAVARLAKSVRSTQLAAWLMGLAVFFDDYANCILVGTTMRPLFDRFRISREKLSYIVDSTAAPVAGISLFSTWIAYEVSTFAPQLPSAGLSVSDGYSVFIETLPYRFYCVLTLFLVFLVVVTGRDFGPMLAAERRARSTGKVVRDGGQPLVGDEATHIEPAPGVVPRASSAVLPVLTFVFVTLEEIVRVGTAAKPGLWSDSGLTIVQKVTTVLAQGQSTRAILVGSIAGFVVSCLLAVRAGAGNEIPRAIYVTLKNMGIALAILYLAWMLGAACTDLGTATYLTELLGDAIAPAALPCLLFLLAAGISFATGTSWGTMSILLPLVVGLAFTLGEQTGLAGDQVPFGGHLLMVMSIGAVLEGAIFGDHCSPISDTTILSSTASASDHIDHTRTQMAYALTTMAVALSLGYFPCAFMGWSPWLGLAASAAALVGIVFFFGRRSEAPAA